jgi:hypothetical protein
MDIEVFRQTMYVRESSHRLRSTPYGTTYRLCDMVWNFALFRREMLADHRWDDELKLGEHAPYFYEVKRAAKWRVACVPEVACYHVPDDRTPQYLGYRRRAVEYFRGYLRRQGLKDYRRIAPREFVDETETKPPVVVLGVGHSGTSILARMLHAAGWDAVDADQPFAESVSVRALNQYVQQHGFLPPRRARTLLGSLPRPWAVKDPRFVMTLHHWMPHLAALDARPALVRITRDLSHVAESYRRRGYRGDLTHMLRQREAMCLQQYERWPWGKLTIEYEKLGAAAKLFRHDRAPGEPQPAIFPPALAALSGVHEAQFLELGEFGAGEPTGMAADSADWQRFQKQGSSSDSADATQPGIQADSQFLAQRDWTGAAALQGRDGSD